MIKSGRFHKIPRLFVLQPEAVSTKVTDFMLVQMLKDQFFICLCIWLVGAFSDILAFGSVKIVKIEFSIKGAQFSIKSAQNRSQLISL